MKTKNFLFTAVLTFGAILFATNVSGQTATATAGTGNDKGTNTGDVQLILKLQDFQELTVNAATSKVEFTYDSRDDYSRTASSSNQASITADGQLTVFSTKKYTITVKADLFDKDLPEGVLNMFAIKATNHYTTELKTTGGITSLTTQPQYLLKAQDKTKNPIGNLIDIEYSITNPSLLLEQMGAKEVISATDEYTTTVTYTIIAG